MKQSTIKLLYPLFIFFLTLSVYIIFAGRLQFLFPVSIYNYFSFLAEAFLHSSLAFVSNPPYLQDLTVVDGKIYMYWGPTPVLLILPLILLFGRNISDALYTTIIASFNPLILYFVLGQFVKLKFIYLSNYQKIILCLFFAFGTVHFYLSIFGSVWFTSQVLSIFYLMISILFMTFYLSSKSLKSLSIASLFFSLAVIGRITLVFYLLLFLAFIFISYLQTGKQKGYLILCLSTFISILTLLFMLNFFYNYSRFGSFFDNGYLHHNLTLHFASDKEQYGFFNSAYIPKNFYYMLINLPSLSSKFPFFLFDDEGNSILFTSPLFLILVSIIKKRYWQTIISKLINFSIILGSGLIIFFLLNFWGTGWVQFGYRYILDVVPFFVLLLAQVIREVPLILIVSLFIVSILINTLGTLWFLSL